MTSLNVPEIADYPQSQDPISNIALLHKQWKKQRQYW